MVHHVCGLCIGKLCPHYIKLSCQGNEINDVKEIQLVTSYVTFLDISLVKHISFFLTMKIAFHEVVHQLFHHKLFTFCRTIIYSIYDLIL